MTLKIMNVLSKNVCITVQISTHSVGLGLTPISVSTSLSWRWGLFAFFRRRLSWFDRGGLFTFRGLDCGYFRWLLAVLLHELKFLSDVEFVAVTDKYCSNQRTKEPMSPKLRWRLVNIDPAGQVAFLPQDTNYGIVFRGDDRETCAKQENLEDVSSREWA